MDLQPLFSLSSQINKSGRVDYHWLRQQIATIDRALFLENFTPFVLFGAIAPENEQDITQTVHHKKRLIHVIYPLMRPEGSCVLSSIFTLGSFFENDMVIPDPSIAHRHARIKVQENKILMYAIHRQRSYKTTVNGEHFPNEVVDLHDGDTLCFGRYSFSLLAPDSLYTLLSEPEEHICQDELYLLELIDQETQQFLKQQQLKEASDTKRTPLKQKETALQPEEPQTVLANEVQDHTDQEEEKILAGTLHKLLSNDPREVFNILNKVKMLQHFSDYEKKRISVLNTYIIRVKNNKYIIREGETTSSFYILLTGSASVIKKGSTLPLDQLRPGAFFGETGFLSGKPRISSVIANEESTVLMIGAELLARVGTLIREKLKDRIIQQFIVRLSRQNQEIIKTLASPYTESRLWQEKVYTTTNASNRELKLSTEASIKILDRLKIFDAFNLAEKQLIASKGSAIKRYTANEAIILHGEESRSCYILLSGEVHVISGRKRRLYLIENKQPGEFFGEISFLSNIKRTAHIVAGQDCLVLKLDQRWFVQVGVDIREKLKDAILQQLLKRLEDNNQTILKAPPRY
ncbi:cyclic nucleotide-binding domain-containing protein [Magnetococcales bacterium HHB-1]